MARKERTQEEEPAIDMTPMLDIVFIMLIFFIVTTVFIKDAGKEVNKPEASESVKMKNANIFIAITDQGEVWLDKKEVEVEKVSISIEKLLKQQPSDVIFVQADKDAEHGKVAKVLDQIRAAGIKRIAYSAKGN